jgi:hypothetical protein
MNRTSQQRFYRFFRFASFFWQGALRYAVPG